MRQREQDPRRRLKESIGNEQMQHETEVCEERIKKRCIRRQQGTADATKKDLSTALVHATFKRLNAAPNVALLEDKVQLLGLWVLPVAHEGGFMFVREQYPTTEGLSHQKILAQSPTALS